MNAGSLTVTLSVDTHGALESNARGVVRRTLALWCLAAAQWLLRSRIDLSFEQRN